MDKEILEHLYDEIRITLVILSLSAKEQCAVTGLGCVGTEILMDFEVYYVDNKELLLSNGYITAEQSILLDDFEEYLVKFNNRTEDFYWDHEVLEKHPDWVELRTKSRDLLGKLFDETYEIKIERDYFGTNNSCERTIRKLIIR